MNKKYNCSNQIYICAIISLMKISYKFKRAESVPTFRRWKNKSFSVFCSLKRVIRIGCLLIIYLKFANNTVIAAQPDTSTVVQNYDLEQVVVTSEQQPEMYSGISRVVLVISQKEIEQAAISSVNELLEYASDIDIRQRGTGGVQADISIRGSSFDQVLILLNGVNITDPQTGHHNLNLPIDFSVIDCIEILKGPGSWKFGPGAFGGAINFITKKDDEKFVRVDLEGGEHLFNAEKLSAGFKIGNSGHLVSINNSSSDGYIENTDFYNRNIFYSGRLKLKDNELQLQTGYTDKGFGSNSFYSAKYPNQYEETSTFLASFSMKINSDNVQFTPRVYYKRHDDMFLLFRDNPGLYKNVHLTEVVGENIVTNFKHETDAVTSLGFDVRTETIHSNNLGDKIDDPQHSIMRDSVLLDRFHSRTNFSTFVGHKRYFSKLMVNAGINFTRNTDMNYKWFIYPGLDLSYSFNDHSSVNASVNKSMRMPTFTELFYTSPSNEGNKDLLPEESLGFELGYGLKYGFIDYSLTGFYSINENLIDWVKENLDDKWKTINYTTINSFGIETMAKVDFQKLIKGQKVLNNLKIAYSYLNQERAGGNLISNYSMNYLKHKLDIDLNHLIWKNVYAVWHVSYSDRNGQYEKIEEKISYGLTDYNPFIICDLKIYWKYKGWNLYGTVNNIFNTEYVDYGNIAQPGRWIKFGVSKKIVFQ